MGEEGSLAEINDKLSRLLYAQDSVVKRIDSLESVVSRERLQNRRLFDLKGDNSAQAQSLNGHGSVQNSTVRGDNSTQGPAALDTGVPAALIQREYESIKDSLTQVRLPEELKVVDTRQGLKREDQSTAAILSKCARYTETALRWLVTQDGNITPDGLQQLYTILQAKVNFIQGECAGLVVKSTFDSETAKVFRVLEMLQKFRLLAHV